MNWPCYISVDEFLPSEWDGNYTCDDDQITVRFVMNFTHTSTVEVHSDMLLGGYVIETEGTYASAFQVLTIQTQHVIQDDINGRNISKVELNLRLQSSVYMNGVTVFKTTAGTQDCTTELRRKTCMYLGFSFLSLLLGCKRIVGTILSSQIYISNV